MNTDLQPALLSTDRGREADAILRACVHCGLCTATCPSYQILGNELDSPRGRIYLIKQALEGADVSDISLRHLDSCLGCRACETTCPSGVNYHRLFDIGQSYIEESVGRGWRYRLPRWILRRLMLSGSVFTGLMRLGQWFRPVLPGFLRVQVPPPRAHLPKALLQERWEKAGRKAVLFDGCVQPGISPQTNEAAALVLAELGIACVAPAALGNRCCGALSYHAGNRAEGLAFARANIDAWEQMLDQGAEFVVSTASGCGAFVKDYPSMLADDPAYADRAVRLASLTKDISEVLHGEELAPLAGQLGALPSAVLHCPCTLQHALGLDSVTRSVLGNLGLEVPAIQDEHLCCGSAGTYSLFQSKVAGGLRDKKLAALSECSPEQIMTANVGCQKYLGEKSEIPVRHWIEVVAGALVKKGET